MELMYFSMQYFVMMKPLDTLTLIDNDTDRFILYKLFRSLNFIENVYC